MLYLDCMSMFLTITTILLHILVGLMSTHAVFTQINHYKVKPVYLYQDHIFIQTVSLPVLPNPRFRRPIGLLLTSAPRLPKPYRYFATFVLLLTHLPRNVLGIGRLCEKLSISCQFRGILNIFNVNEQINHKLIGLRRHIEPSKSFENDYPQLPEVGQSIVFPPIWVIFG